jgi:hypothetical protein
MGITGVYWPGFSFMTGVASGRVGGFERGFGGHAQIAAVVAGLRIFGIIHGQGREVVAAIEVVGDHLDFLARLGLVLRLAVLQVVHLGIRDSRNHDLGQVILGFDQVELGLVIVVVIAHVLVGDVDARGNFFVQDFVAGERAAQVALEVVERDFLVLQALVEFFGGVGGLDFVELAIDFFVGGQQTELFGALHQDFGLDQLVQNA